jgi:hypothetical protein
LTRTPSEAQLTTPELDQYINTAVLYDFPGHLRLFSLRTNLTFYTQPGVDVYRTNTTDPLDPLYNFQNKYIAVHPPVFIAGVQAFFTQWRDVFYGQWPQTNAVVDTLLDGDGSTGPFVGIVPSFPPTGTPVGTNSGRILQNSVIFTALDISGTAMVIVDYPVSNVLGALGLPNEPQTLPSPYGDINYQTGAFTLNFPSATMSGIANPIYVEYIAYVPGKPISVLYYDNQFTLRPVPDKSYPVQIEVDIRPTELLDQAVSPQIEQWWQFISILASKKIFEDRMDMDSVQMLMPSLREQMNLVNRTSLVQQANMRTVTIYTQGRQYWGWGGWGPNFPF